MRYLIVILFLSNVQYSFSQAPKGVLDGSKIFVDILKSFNGKKKLSSDTLSDTSFNCDKNTAKLCFQNNVLGTLEVFLLTKNSINDTLTFIVSSGMFECGYDLPSNVYEYLIKDSKSKAILRKGQIKLENCDDLELVIR